jgi:hypothetical protein
MPEYFFRRSKTPLTGINDLKGKYAGKTAVFWCSGPTFATYDNARVPEDWVRFSINETIRTHGNQADFWVLSDQVIVDRFATMCPEDVWILAMHASTDTIAAKCPRNKVWTVNSMDEIKDFANGYEFFSRRTVLIGGVEMARYMGFTRFFVFGLDLFRLRRSYYYDGAEAIAMADRGAKNEHMVRTLNRHEGQRIYQSPHLRQARLTLESTAMRKLWAGLDIHVVGSPLSCQSAVPKMSWEDFDKEAASDKKARKPVRPDVKGREEGAGDIQDEGRGGETRASDTVLQAQKELEDAAAPGKEKATQETVQDAEAKDAEAETLTPQ